MRILLINVDAEFNLAIRKLYNYYAIIKNYEVDMQDLKYEYYPHHNEFHCFAGHYDQVYVSNIFETNKDRVKVYGCKCINIGGVCSNFPMNKLPKEIDNLEPYYFSDENVSYGFITRGCIRNCYFCKVPKTEGKLRFYCDVSKIVKHDKVIFMDNNILAYDGCCDVFRWLIEHKTKCNFKQGLDFRLVNDENLELLSKLHYYGEYFFAFDDINYEKAINEKLPLIKKYIDKNWKLKFFLYYNPKDPIKDLIYRIDWCMKNKCLPYVMRDISCWSIPDINVKNFLTDITAYCNQPNILKKLSFEEFLYRRHTNKDRIENSLNIYNKNR